MSRLERWLCQAISWVQEPPDESVVEELWSLFDIDGDVKDILVRLRVRWRQGRLEVAAQGRESAGVMGELAGALMGAWRFVKFSESRWMGLATLGRTLLVAHLSGIGSLIDFCRRDRTTSEYHIKVYDRFSSEAHQLIAIASISSGPAEVGKAILLEDGRLMRQCETIQSALLGSIGFVHGLSYDLFDYIGAGFLGMDGTCFRSKVFFSVVSAASFVSSRILKKGTDLPWSPCLGDSLQNLEALASLSEPPAEPASLQLYKLWHLGFPKEGLVDIVNELRDVDHTSVDVEQSQAVATQVLRHHPEIEGDSLWCRAFLGIARALLSAHSVDVAIEQQKVMRQVAISRFAQSQLRVSRGMRRNEQK